MNKKLLLPILVFLFLLLFLGFYWYGSSGNLSSEKYVVLKTYNPKGSTITKDTFSILTYNIGYLSGMTNNRAVNRTKLLFEENLDRAIRLLGKLQPDIIGFQEIDFESDRSYGVNQLEQVATRLDYGYAYQSINWDKRYVPFPYWPPSVHFRKIISGQAILSHFPLTPDSTVVLSKPINTSFIYDAFYLERLLQITSIQIADRQVVVMNVHLEAFDEATRIQQAGLVAEIYRNYAAEGPVLLVGDFNSKPQWEDGNNGAMRILEEEDLVSAISQASYQANPSAYFTFSSHQPYQMIDYILYSPEFIEVIEAKIIREASDISDHLPVLMKFRFID